MRRGWAFVLGLLCAGVVWRLAHPSPRPAVRSSTVDAPEPARAPESEVLAAPAVDAQSASAEARTPTRESADPAPADGEGARARIEGTPLLVHVVDESGAPVAGADVRFVDLALAYEQAPELVLDGYDADGLIARFATRSIADAAGLVHVVKNEAGGVLIAEKDGLCGIAVFDHHEGDEQTLVLVADRSVSVHVVDASGAPAAGVRVALRSRNEHDVRDAWLTTTDREGSARLSHLQEFFPNGVVEDEGFCVALAVLALAPIEAPLTLGPLPSAPIELALPATGSLEIHLEDAAGKPLAQDALVDLEVAHERSEMEEWQRQYLRRSNSDRRQIVTARNGIARVDPIGLALSLELTVTPFSGLRPVTASVRGPERPGELASVRVPVKERIPVLAGRLVRADGSPFASRHVEASLWVKPRDGGSSGRYPRFDTDADGRFALPLDADSPLDSRVELELWCDDADGRRAWRKFEREEVLVPGTNELGDVVLAPLAVLAAGRVVDAGGAGVRAAKVELDGAPDGFAVGWVRSQVTGADGAFVLQGDAELSSVRFHVAADGFSARTFEVAPGTRDFLVALAAGGGIAGSLLVADPRALTALRVRATHESGDVNEIEPDEQGRFAFQDLPVGRHEIAIVLAHEPEFELRVPDVVLEPGAVGRDPRLHDVDLRALLRTFEITLHAPDDDSSLDTFVRRRASGAGEFVADEEWSYDDTVFTTSHAALDLRITAEDYRTVVLDGVAEDRIVELQPELRLAVHLSPRVELGAEEWLELGLTSREGAPLSELFGPRFFDGESLETAVPEPGTYAARLVFLQQAIDDLRETPLPLGAEVLLTVADREGVQRFEIAVPPAALAAIERARADPPPKAR